MATKTATVAQPETPEARDEGPDAPLLDTLGAELKKLVQKGKERGRSEEHTSELQSH